MINQNTKNVGALFGYGIYAISFFIVSALISSYFIVPKAFQKTVPVNVIDNIKKNNNDKYNSKINFIDRFYYVDKLHQGTSKIFTQIELENSYLKNYTNEPLNISLKKILYNNFTIKNNNFNNALLLAGHVSTDYKYGYIGMNLFLSENSLTKLKNAKGIKFKAFSDKYDYKLIVETTDVKDSNFFVREFSTNGEVKELEILFDDLKQENRGNNNLVFNKELIYRISFQTTDRPCDVCLVVSNFEVIDYFE